MPLVSVIIPLYNCQNYIEETLCSVINQTYDNVELVIVDDGSTDSSLSIVQEVVKENPRRAAIVYSQRNSGGCVARNKGVELANGEYIQFLDNDDVLSKTKIEKQIEALRLYKFDPHVVAFSEWEGIEHGEIHMADKLKHDYDIPVDIMVDMFLGHSCIYPHAFLTSKALVSEAGPWNQKMARDDDGEFFSRVYAKAQKLIYVKQTKVLYRFGNPDSLSKVESPHLIEGMVFSSLNKVDILLKKSSHPKKNDAIYEELTCHLRLYYPYYSYLRLLTENYIKKWLPDKKISHPRVPVKAWIYYYWVKLGMKKSLYRP